MATINERLSQYGYDFTTDDLTLDAEIHELKTPTFSGWYVGSLENHTTTGASYATLTLHDWLEGKNHFFKSGTENFTKTELEEITARQAQQRREFDQRKKQIQEELSERATEQWRGLQTVDGIPRYLERKGLLEALSPESGRLILKDETGEFLGAKILSDQTGEDYNLVVPMKDVNGKLWNYQTISQSSKTFLDGGRVQGLFHLLGPLHAEGVVYICEGFATAATVHLCSGKTALVAFHAGNMVEVAQSLRANYPNLKIVICGDEDRWKLNPATGRPYFTGRKAAYEAAKTVRGSTCQVSFENCSPTAVNEKQPTDFNDLLLLSSAPEVRRQIEEHYETTPLEYIETEHTGFHEAVQMKNGSTRFEPVQTDLRDYYERLHTFVTVDESEKVYVYRGGAYLVEPKGVLLKFAQDHYKINGREVSDSRMRSEFHKLTLVSNQVSVDWFNESTEGLVNFKNGILNMRTGEFSPHDPKHGFLFQLQYDYDPEALCPTWDTMLKRVTGDNPDLIAMLEEFIGYTLSGDKTWIQKALVLVGDGQNGKSTFIQVVQNLIGEENFATLKMSELGSQYSMDSLNGKLANLCEENSVKGFKTDSFKNLVTGGWTTARAPYCPEYKFRNRGKFIISFNDFDRAPELSKGFMRRLLIAPFNVVIDKTAPDFDPHIEDKLAGELSGIFNRVRAAYKRCLERGDITEAKVTSDALTQLKKESNPVEQFVDECVEVVGENWTEPNNREGFPVWFDWDSEGPFVWLPDLYAEYHEWAKCNGYLPLSAVGFVRKFRRVWLERGVSIGEVVVKRRQGRCVKSIRNLIFSGISRV